MQETKVSTEAAEKVVKDRQMLMEEVDAITATTPIIENYCRVDNVPAIFFHNSLNY